MDNPLHCLGEVIQTLIPENNTSSSSLIDCPICGAIYKENFIISHIRTHSNNLAIANNQNINCIDRSSKNKNSFILSSIDEEKFENLFSDLPVDAEIESEPDFEEEPEFEFEDEDEDEDEEENIELISKIKKKNLILNPDNPLDREAILTYVFESTAIVSTSTIIS